MRLILLLTFSIISSCGGSSSALQTPYFKVVEATSQEWIAGAKGSGMGTTYQFKVITKTTEKVEYRTAWIGKESFSIAVKRPLENMDKPLKKGEELILESVKRVYPDQVPEGMPEVTKMPIPFEYEGDALILYLVDGEKKYLAIPALQKLPRVNHM